MALLKVKFKDITIGTEFNFWHPPNVSTLGIAQGPWVKIGRRHYRRTGPGVSAPQWSKIEVGTVNAFVEVDV